MEPLDLAAGPVTCHHGAGGHAAAEAVARLLVHGAAAAARQSGLALAARLGARGSWRSPGGLLRRAAGATRAGQFLAGPHSAEALALLLLLLLDRHGDAAGRWAGGRGGGRLLGGHGGGGGGLS